MRLSRGGVLLVALLLLGVRLLLLLLEAPSQDEERQQVSPELREKVSAFEEQLAQKPSPASCASASGEPLVTFIVPSQFRPSLALTLASLQAQSSCHWRALVVYRSTRLRESDESEKTRGTVAQYPSDHFHVLPKNQLDDDRITFLESSASAEVNFAGAMRNDALAHIPRDEEGWVAFVDDDDTLLPHYVESLLKEATTTPHAEAVLFRMLCLNCYTLVIPPHNHLNLVRSYSGISFAIKNSLLTRNSEYAAVSSTPYSFPSGANEDYCLLYNIRNGGHTLVMSPVITYLVKGPQTIYNEELQRSNGGLQPLINRSIITAVPGTYPAECIQKQLPKDAQNDMTTNVKSKHLGFSFPEAGHYIFQQNIAGLQSALTQANAAGCLLPWLLEHLNIEIHFSYLTPPPKDRPYIQVQMEQIHSRRNMFTDTYVSKLKGALQVWAIAPSHYAFLQHFLHISQTFFVPIWLMVDPAISSHHICRNQSLVPKQAIVERVVNNIPYTPDSKNNLLEECIILPRFPKSKDEYDIRNQISKKDKKNKKIIASYSNTPFCLSPRVVLYGALKGSDNDRRLKMCVALKESLPSESNFECFHGIYGVSLDKVLCEADIVIVDRFYANGAVESHRIDPLLKMGKVVISTFSKDQNMQSLYQKAIVFAESFDDIVVKVNEFLNDNNARKIQEKRGQDFITRKMRNSQPLCHTFSDIQQKLILHSEIKPSLVHIETPKEKEKRLKRNGKPPVKKVRPIPPSPPMPDEILAMSQEEKLNKPIVSNRKKGIFEKFL